MNLKLVSGSTDRLKVQTKFQNNWTPSEIATKSSLESESGFEVETHTTPLLQVQALDLIFQDF